MENSRNIENELPISSFSRLDFVGSKEFLTVFQTDEFKNWFSQSKFKTNDGTPLLFFTGGAPNIKKFNRNNPRHSGVNQQGYYFSPDKNYARFYASTFASTQAEEGFEPIAGLYTVCLKTTQPLIIDKDSVIDPYSIDTWPNGYDCIINQKTGIITEIAVKDPEQIWSLKEEIIRTK